MEYVLAIALLTWGGVFAYILRLEKLTRSLEREVEVTRNESKHTETIA